MLKNMEQADSLKIKYQPPSDRTCSTRIVCCFEPASSVP